MFATIFDRTSSPKLLTLSNIFDFAFTGSFSFAAIDLSSLAQYSGKHALYFVFTSATEGKSIATLHDFYFTAD